MTDFNVPIIGELERFDVNGNGLSQAQVNRFRDTFQKLIKNVNTLAAGVSVAFRLFAGEKPKPGVGNKLPGLVQGLTFTSTDPVEVAHGLGRYPNGYLILRKYPGGDVFDASPQEWNPTTAFLQTDSPGLTVTVLFF